MSTALTKLAAYLRVSSLTQKNEDTITRQKDNFETAWESLKTQYQLLPRFSFLDQTKPENRLFIDENFNLEHLSEDTACYDLLSRCERGEIDAVYVSEIDRLCRSRSSQLRGKIQDILENHDITVITKSGEIPLGIAFGIISCVGAEDKKAIMLKMQEGKISRCEKEGRPPSGKTPFGFERNKFTKEWLTIPEEVVVIKCAIGLVIGKTYPEMPPAIATLAHAYPGGLPDPKIIEALNACGFSVKNHFIRNSSRKWLEKNPHGKISRGFVNSIFEHDRFRGSYEVRLKEPNQVGKAEYKNLHRSEKRKIIITIPRIISDDDWKEVKNRRKFRQVHAKRNTNHEYLARNILYCGICGIKMSARPKWGEKKRKTDGGISKYAPTLYYVCTRRQKVNGFRCLATRCHAGPKLDVLLWEKVKECILRPDSIAAIQSIRKESDQSANLPKLVEEQTKLQERSQQFEEKKERLRTLLVDGTFDKQEYSRDKMKIDTEIHGVHKLQRQLDKQIQILRKSLEEAPGIDIKLIQERYLNRLDSLAFEEKRSIVSLIVKQVLIHPDGKLLLQLRPLIF